MPQGTGFTPHTAGVRGAAGELRKVLQEQIAAQLLAEDVQFKRAESLRKLGQTDRGLDQDDLRIVATNFGNDTDRLRVNDAIAAGAQERPSQIALRESQARDLDRKPEEARIGREHDVSMEGLKHTNSRDLEGLKSTNARSLEGLRQVGSMNEIRARGDEDRRTQREKPLAPRAPTGAQQRARGFYTRGREAADIMDETEPLLSKSDIAIITGTPAGGLLESAAHLGLSEAGQRYIRASRQFTEARLRKESGAQIAGSEYDTDRKISVRQAGDRPSVTADRKRARQTILEGMAAESGGAYDEFYGEPFRRAGSDGAYTGERRTLPDGTTIGRAPSGEILTLEQRNGQWYPVR